MITQYELYGQDRQEPFNHFEEVVVRSIKYQEAWFVIGCDLACKTAADAAAVYNDMMFGILLQQCFVNKLHVAQHFPFAPFAGAFSKAAVVYKHHIVVVAVKVHRIFGPALDASAVAMKIEDQSGRVIAVKMEAIDPDAGLNIKEIFAEGDLVSEFEILPELLGFENEIILEEIGKYREQGNAGKDIPE